MAPSTEHHTDESERLPSVDPLDESAGGRRTWIYVAGSAIAALVAVWIYILFFYHPALLIDELEDKAFPRQAEEICAAAADELDELPFANLATSADNRADTVEQSNVILREMIAELRPLSPTSPPVASEAVNEWLDDWLVYIGDREEYVENLREDPRARFLESPKGDGPKGITRAIDGYAQVNSMPSCQTPMDVS